MIRQGTHAAYLQLPAHIFLFCFYPHIALASIIFNSTRQLAALDMTFEIDDDSGGLGVVKTVDLLQGMGSLRRVLTRGDADQYIRFVVKYWMFDRIKHHIEHIRLGINDVVRCLPAPLPPTPLHHPFFSAPISLFCSEVKMCLMISPRFLCSSSTCSTAQSCRLYCRAPKQPSMWSKRALPYASATRH
jgi:hypothetical protein